MRKRILTAIIFAFLAVLCVIPADAATRTKLTLVIEASAPVSKVSEDLVSDDGTFSGTPQPSRTYTDDEGRSVTETHTLFTNRAGVVIMSADTRITSVSEDFTAVSGERFAQTMSVDVRLELYDAGYGEYMYSLDVAGLPEWLVVSGETTSNDTISVGVNEYHHEFAVAGTPETSHDAKGITFTALIYVSGDWPVLFAKGDKEVKVSADTVPKPPDTVPKSPDVSPDVIPKSPDVSPDVSPDPSPDVVPRPPDVSPDVSRDTSPDVVPRPPSYIETLEENIDGGGSGGGTGTRTLSEAMRHLTEAEKAAVRTLKVNSYITDLTGLNEFANLEELDLTEAVYLEAVDLSGNSSVRSVDVSGNTALKVLTLTGSKVENINANGCTSLEEVNVSGCTTLKTLNVSRTPITSLNAENCAGLEVLDCSSCRIEELKLTGCDLLSVLDCSNNRLQRLDAYMFARLRELECRNQRITGWIIGRVFSFAEHFANISAADEGSISGDTGVENVTNLAAWDAEGNEVTAEYDNETGIALFSAEPAKIAYDYITGFEDVNMDVTVFASEDEPPNGLDGLENCGGGCNTELTFPLMLVVMCFLVFARKHEREDDVF